MEFLVDCHIESTLCHLSSSWETTHRSFILLLRSCSLYSLTDCNLHYTFTAKVTTSPLALVLCSTWSLCHTRLHFAKLSQRGGRMAIFFKNWGQVNKMQLYYFKINRKQGLCMISPGQKCHQGREVMTCPTMDRYLVRFQHEEWSWLGLWWKWEAPSPSQEYSILYSSDISLTSDFISPFSIGSLITQTEVVPCTRYYL